MNIKNIEDNIIVINITYSELDIISSREFKEEIRNILDNHKNTYFILDLSHIKFIDSSGLGSLIHLLKYSTFNKNKILLAALTKRVNSLFKLMRLNKVFDIFDSIEDGINFVKILKENH